MAGNNCLDHVRAAIETAPSWPHQFVICFQELSTWPPARAAVFSASAVVVVTPNGNQIECHPLSATHSHNAFPSTDRANDIGIAIDRVPCVFLFSTHLFSLSPLPNGSIDTVPIGLRKHYSMCSLITGVMFEQLYWNDVCLI